MGKICTIIVIVFVVELGVVDFVFVVELVAVVDFAFVVDSSVATVVAVVLVVVSVEHKYKYKIEPGHFPIHLQEFEVEMADFEV